MKYRARTHEGRVALVTGAAQGTGRAVALALAQRAAQVIATDSMMPHLSRGQLSWMAVNIASANLEMRCRIIISHAACGWGTTS